MNKLPSFPACPGSVDGRNFLPGPSDAVGLYGRLFCKKDTRCRGPPDQSESFAIQTDRR